MIAGSNLHEGKKGFIVQINCHASTGGFHDKIRNVSQETFHKPGTGLSSLKAPIIILFVFLVLFTCLNSMECVLSYSIKRRDHICMYVCMYVSIYIAHYRR